MVSQELSKFQYAFFKKPLSKPLITANGEITHAEGFYLRARKKGTKVSLISEGTLTLFKESEKTKIKKELEDIFLNWTTKHAQEILWPASLQYAYSVLANLNEVEKVPDGYSLNALIGANFSSAAELSKKIQDKISQGYKVIKLKISQDNYRLVAQTIQGLELAEEIKFRLDANSSFSAAEAERVLAAFSILTPGRIEYFEDICGYEDLSLVLKNASNLPLAIDEPIRTSQDLEKISENFPLDIIFVIKPSQLGNWQKTQDLIFQERKKGRKIVISGAMESEIGIRSILREAVLAMPVGSVFGLSTSEFFVDTKLNLPAQIKMVPSLDKAEEQWLNALDWVDIE